MITFVGGCFQQFGRMMILHKTDSLFKAMAKSGLVTPEELPAYSNNEVKYVYGVKNLKLFIEK